jgi:isoaspartyl peptidase/L-asparaginase-like protein (Ntn-hydrolase superfamily)
MRANSSLHIVEQIRQGIELEVAVSNALERIKRDKHLNDDMQVGLLVIRRDGVWWAGSLRDGFQFAAASGSQANTLYQASGIHYSIVK